jgi:hypothetical protein
MIDEVEINMEGRCNVPVDVPSWDIPAETEKNHNKSISSRCHGRDSNLASQEHKIVTATLTRYDQKIF